MKYIRYHKPNRNKTKTQVKTLEGFDRTIRTHTTDVYHNKDLLIPASCMIHPKAIYDLIQLKNKPAFTIAMLLTTYINNKEQKGEVTVSQEELAINSSLNIRTVSLALTFLEDYGYLSHIGKQKYKISAELGWFGEQVDWAIALQKVE